MKIDWDLTLSEDLILECTVLLSNLTQLKPIELPRFCLKDFSFDDINGIEMHGFSDASLKAYGCVIYLKFIFKDGKVVTMFLCSKTKIKLTIPRPGFMVCTLLLSLIQNCVNSLSPIFNEILYLQYSMKLKIHVGQIQLIAYIGLIIQVKYGINLFRVESKKFVTIYQILNGYIVLER